MATAPLQANDPGLTAVVMRTSAGDITLHLNAEKAPLSVENFLLYANAGHYNGTLFHRVIEGFVIQGGGLTADYELKSTFDPVANEADNGLKNTRYSIAMARTADPQSATAQFFINLTNNTFLDYTAPTDKGWGYAVFGQVVDGFDVVDEIAESVTGPVGPFPSDVPVVPVIIESVEVL